MMKLKGCKVVDMAQAWNMKAPVDMVYKAVIKKYSNGARIPSFKRFIGRRVVVFVLPNDAQDVLPELKREGHNKSVVE